MEVEFVHQVNYCFRLSFQSSKLASIFWRRIRGHLKTIVIDKDPHDIHIEGVPLLMKGTWVPKGLNDVSCFKAFLKLIIYTTCLLVN